MDELIVNTRVMHSTKIVKKVWWADGVESILLTDKTNKELGYQ